MREGMDGMRRIERTDSPESCFSATYLPVGQKNCNPLVSNRIYPVNRRELRGAHVALDTVPSCCSSVAFCETNPASAKVTCGSPTEEANLHASAETNSSVLEVLQCGEKVSVTEKQGDWYSITATSGKPGYVRSSFLTFPKVSNEAEHSTAYMDCLPPHVSVSLLDVPDGDKTMAEESCNEKVSVLEPGMKWEKIEDGSGHVGYVRAMFLSQNPKPKFVPQESVPQRQNSPQMPTVNGVENGAYPLAVRVLQAEQVPYVVQISSGQVSTSCAINGSSTTYGTAVASANVAFGNSTSYSNLTKNVGAG